MDLLVPQQRRWRLVLGVLALAAVASLPLRADSPAVTDVSACELLDVASLDLKASRMVGFAPMRLEVSGTLIDADGHELHMPAGAEATLLLESPSYRSFGDDAGASVVFVDHTEDDDSLSRSLVIHQPGTYTLRWVVKDGDRETVQSDEVRIRVL
jgi:hypothetical protein